MHNQSAGHSYWPWADLYQHPVKKMVRCFGNQTIQLVFWSLLLHYQLHNYCKDAGRKFWQHDKKNDLSILPTISWTNWNWKDHTQQLMGQHEGLPIQADWSCCILCHPLYILLVLAYRQNRAWLAVAQAPIDELLPMDYKIHMTVCWAQPWRKSTGRIPGLTIRWKTSALSV